MLEVKIAGMQTPRYGRCDYCGERSQLLYCVTDAADETQTGTGETECSAKGLEAYSCAYCGFQKPFDIPVPLAVWARSRGLERIEWHEPPPQMLTHTNDVYKVGDVFLEPVPAPGREGDYWAGVVTDTLQERRERTVVYWYDARAWEE